MTVTSPSYRSPAICYGHLKTHGTRKRFSGSNRCQFPSIPPQISLQLSFNYPSIIPRFASIRFNSLQFDLATPVMKSTDADTGADSINKSAPTTSIKTGVAALNRNLQFRFVLIYRRWSDGVDGVNQRRQRRQRRQRHAISSFSINATWLFNRPINRRPIPSETDSG